MKRKLMVLLTALMVVSTTGCSLFPPKTAVEMAEKYKAAAEKYENYEIEGTVNCDMKLEIQGVAVDIPIEFALDVKTDGKENIYTSMELDVEVMNEKTSASSESYMVVDGKDVEIWECKDDGAWVHSEKDSEDVAFTGVIVPEQFETGELEKKEDSYVISLELEKLFESDAFKKMLGENDDLFSGVDSEKILKQLGKAKATYTFDKKSCLLQKMTLDEFAFSEEFSSDGQNLDFSMVVSMDLEVKNYGELDRDDYTVSDSIKEKAVEASDIPEDDSDEDFFMETPAINEKEESIPNESDIEELELSEDVQEESESLESDIENDTSAEILENDNNTEPTSSEEYILKDYDGNILGGVYCPSNFYVTASDENSVEMENADGYYIYVRTLPDSWAWEYLTTGTFTKDMDFYSYEEVSIYDTFETAYGTVTILQKDWAIADIDDEITSTYCVILNTGEYSPSFSMISVDLEDIGMSIDTLAHEIFR